MMPPTIMVVSTSPPSIVVTSAPSIMMTSAAAMPPTVAVTTSHLDNRVVSAGKCIRVCARHCRRRQGWSERKSAGRKSDQQKPLHEVFPLLDRVTTVAGNAAGTRLFQHYGLKADIASCPIANSRHRTLGPK